jgi:hypothetical protein
MMNLAKRSFRRRSMNMEMMKMTVWCPVDRSVRGPVDGRNWL